MTEKRFNRTITGEIYDSQNDDFVDEDYGGKPICYEDGVIILLNTLHEENEQLKKQLHYCKSFVVNNNGKDVQRIFFKSLEDLE